MNNESSKNRKLLQLAEISNLFTAEESCRRVFSVLKPFQDSAYAYAYAFACAQSSKLESLSDDQWIWLIGAAANTSWKS